MVQAAAELVLIHLAAGVADEVIEARVLVARRVGLREVLDELARDRLDPVGRDYVAGERRADVLPRARGVRFRRQGVVDSHHLAAIVQRAAEVAGPFERRGQGGEEDVAAAPGAALVVREEEGLVRPNRAAHGPSELVHAKWRNGPAGALVEELVGVELAVAQKLEQSAVELVGSAPRGNVHHASAAAAPLRREAVGLHLELLRRLHGGNRRDLVEEPGRARHAVDLHFIGLEPSSIDGEVRIPRGIDGEVAELPVGGGGAQNAGRQLHQAEGAAAVQRNVRDFRGVHHLAQRRTVLLQYGRGGRYFHRLRHLPDLQDEVQACHLVHRQGHSIPRDRTETGLLHFHAVRADGQQRNGENAARIGHGLNGNRCGRVGDGDIDAGNDGFAGIGHTAGDLRRLAECRQRQQEEDQKFRHKSFRVNGRKRLYHPSGRVSMFLDITA